MGAGQHMDRIEEESATFRTRGAQVCAAVVVAVALLALAGWTTGRLILARLHVDFIPMPPSAAVALLALGGALYLLSGRPTHPWVRWVAGATVMPVFFLCLLILGQHLAGTDLGPEGRLSAASAAFGRVPIGRMSPLGAGTFIVTSLAMLALTVCPLRWRLLREAAASASAGVMVVGILTAMGYAWDVPVLHGGGLIPIALPTALAFVCLGAGSLLASGPHPWGLRDSYPVIVGFGAGLGISIMLFALVSRQEEGRIQEDFTRKAHEFGVAIHAGLRDNLAESENLRALFSVTKRVDREAFEVFTAQALERHPSIRGFSWSPRVLHADREATEAAARRDGVSAYQFTEEDPRGGLRPARRRSAYVPAHYIEPFAGNQAALGFDRASDPRQLVALEKARDTEQPAATAPTVPISETQQESEILVFHPVYQPGKPATSVAERNTRLRGFVVEALRVGHLIHALLPEAERQGLEYRLVDVTATLHEDPVAASAGADAAARTGLTSVTWIPVADRRWRLELSPAPWYLAARHSDNAWLVLGCGLLLTMLLATYLLASARRTAEVTQLAESLRKISLAVEHSPTVVVITDTTGTIEYVNPKFTQVTGYAVDEVRGQNPRILKSGKMPPEIYQQLWATITGGQEWRGEFHNKKKSGELYWEAASVSPVRGPDGRITHFVAVKEDISERKRVEESLRESESRFRAVAHSAADAIISADHEGRIIFWNKGARAIFGYDDVEIEGQSIDVLAPVRFHQNAHRQKIARLRLTGKPDVLGRTSEVVGKRKDGTEFPLELSLATWQAGGETFYTAIARDISKRKRAEKALAARTRQLGAVHRVSVEITQELDLDRLLELIMRRAMELTATDAAVLFLWEAATERLVPRAWSGLGEWIQNLHLRLGEGVVGVSAERRAGMIVNDYRTSPSRLPTVLEHTEIRSIMSEPLLYRDRLVGVLALSNKVSDAPFDAEDQQLILLFAAQAAIAIENARLHDVAMRRAEQLALLNQVTQTLRMDLDLPAATAAILEALQMLLPGAAGQIWHYRPEEEALDLIDVVGMESRETVGRRRLRIGEGLAGRAAATKEEVFSPDVRVDPRFVNQAWADKEGLVTGLAVPLVFGSALQGGLVLFTRTPRRFREDEMGLLRSFAAEAAITFANVHLFRAVREHAATLERRVAERTAELQRMTSELRDALQQAEAGNQAKSDFLINMSHELRTPLNSILGFGQLLQERLSPQGDSKHVRYIANICASGHHLLGIINDLLDLSRVERGGLALQCAPMDATEVLRDALAAAQGLAGGKGLTLRESIQDPLPVAQTDPLRLKQILLNLLSNAVKFTPAGGTITVTARGVTGYVGDLAPGFSDTVPRRGVTEAPGSVPPTWLELSVTDTGIGMRPEDLPRLFRRFAQLESPLTKHHEGTGLGLSLTKRLVELHGGRIWATSEGVGKGSRFTIVLPAEDSRVGSTRPQASARVSQ